MKNVDKYAYLLKKMEKINSKMQLVGITETETSMHSEGSHTMPNQQQETSESVQLKDPLVGTPKGRSADKHKGPYTKSKKHKKRKHKNKTKKIHTADITLFLPPRWLQIRES